MSVDDLVIVAYNCQGLSLKEIEYGSELHKLLNDRLVRD